MIFIDAMLPCVPNRCWRYRESCHLFCDGNLEELHAFALALGLRRSWFQNKRDLPHYDLTVSKRAAAMRMGAAEADQRTTAYWIRWWRERNRKVFR